MYQAQSNCLMSQDLKLGGGKLFRSVASMKWNKHLDCLKNADTFNIQIQAQDISS